MQKFKKEKTALINEQIFYNKLRVLDDSGQLGVMSNKEALSIANNRGLDLILISEQAEPPVAKILDANKYFYQQKREAKEQAKRQRENTIEVKEVQFRPGIGDHDFATKLKSIEKFLNKGAKVKCMVRYRGRENANKQPGFEVLNRVIEHLIEIAEWESKPSLNGNRLIGILKRGKNEQS
jgi:translation initiation factor IF-3